MPKNSATPVNEQQQARDPVDIATEISAEDAAARDAEIAADARRNPEILKENRRKLGVDETHETPVMKERRRGTFP